MAGDGEVVLLDCKQSMFGMRVRVALAEKGVDYEYKEQDLRNKTQLLLESNPLHKKVPVLIHNGKCVCESSVIVEYIDQVWNDKNPLMPSDPYQRAQARFWTNYIDQKAYAPGRKLWFTKGEEHEAAKKDFSEFYKTMENVLGDKLYFGGVNFGYLDVCFVTFTCWFYAYEKCGNFKMEEECPKLVAWGKRCIERESVAKSLVDPEEIYEFVLYGKKLYGIE